MLRTFAACAVTASLTAAITTGVGVSAHSTKPPPAAKYVKTVGLGDTAIFASQDLICVNSAARLACSSYASPYLGIGVWFTHKTVTITRPPNVRVIASFVR
jgi:hypothetical protein